jgi:hypothetical protein
MRPKDPQAAALQALAAYGPFFACAAHSAESPDEPWRPLSELVEDRAVLSARVQAVREHLATAAGRPPAAVEARVAASVTHLGLVARVVSPLFALTALHGSPPVPALRAMRWRPLLGGSFPLSLPSGTFALCDTSVSETASHILDTLVMPLTDAAAELSLSRRTLRGNIASAVNGAGLALTTAVPAEQERIARTVRAFLAQDTLRDTYTYTEGGQLFRRRSCCLIYRTAPGADRTGAICGDCVLLNA